MAQHIPMHLFQNKKLQDFARRVKDRKKMTRYGSLLWQEVSTNRFVYLRNIKVPNSIVCGGVAMCEVTTDDSLNILEVYLVA